MKWSDLTGVIGGIAPMLGTLIGGPAGGAVGGMIASALGCGNSPDDVSQALKTNPDAAVKLAKIESDERVKLQGLTFAHADNQIAADTQALQAVNATMQAETKGEHWPTYSWRPFNGFIVGTMAFGCYFVLPLAKVPVPPVPETVWLMFGAILGVASWFRGKAQEAQAGAAKG